MSSDDPDHTQTVSQEPTLVLAFHKLLDQLSYGSTNYSPRRFVQLLKRLEDSRYRLAWDSESSESENDRRVLVTFDDGYQHLRDVLPPFMEQFRFRPLVFLPTRFIGRDNTWDYSNWFKSSPHLEPAGIQELVRLGVQIGSHGHSHHALTGLDDKKLAEELSRSKEILENMCGCAVTTLSYPFGRADLRVQIAALKAGYKSGYTMKFPSVSDTPLSRGRFAVYGFDTSFTILQRLNKGPLYHAERVKTGITNLLSTGTVLLHRLRRSGEAAEL